MDEACGVACWPAAIRTRHLTSPKERDGMAGPDAPAVRSDERPQANGADQAAPSRMSAASQSRWARVRASPARRTPSVCQRLELALVKWLRGVSPGMASRFASTWASTRAQAIKGGGVLLKALSMHPGLGWRALMCDAAKVFGKPLPVLRDRAGRVVIHTGTVADVADSAARQAVCSS